MVAYLIRKFVAAILYSQKATAEIVQTQVVIVALHLATIIAYQVLGHLQSTYFDQRTLQVVEINMDP